MELLFNEIKKLSNIDIVYISIFCTSIVIIIDITVKLIKIIINNKKIDVINETIHKIKNNQDEINFKINELYNMHDNKSQLYNKSQLDNKNNNNNNKNNKSNNKNKSQLYNNKNEYVDII
jgi:hypothetical protein